MQDRYILSLAQPEEMDELYTLIRDTWARLENKDVFAVEDMTRDGMDIYRAPKGFCVTARTESGELAGVLAVCFPGLSGDNLGYDLGFEELRLMQVCVMDIAAVDPRHRGYRLEQRLLLFAEQQLDGTPYTLLMCSVSPDNPASLHSVEKCGYRVMLTKEKYGGRLRHILMKERE